MLVYLKAFLRSHSQASDDVKVCSGRDLFSKERLELVVLERESIRSGIIRSRGQLVIDLISCNLIARNVFSHPRHLIIVVGSAMTATCLLVRKVYFATSF